MTHFSALCSIISICLKVIALKNVSGRLLAKTGSLLNETCHKQNSLPLKTCWVKCQQVEKKRTIKSHTGLNSLDCISIIYKFVLWTHATVTWQNKVIVIIRLCPTGKYLDYNTSNYAFNKTKVPESQTNTSRNSHSLSFKVINPTLMHRQCAVFLCTDGEEQKQ